MVQRKADQISQKSNFQYHIGCKRGDIAKNIIFVGDPQRAFRISTYFEEIRFRQQHREFIAFTGKYKKFPISVMATGIGQGNMEIAIIEVSQIVDKPRIIRSGTSSALQKDIRLGEMIIAEKTHDLGNVSSYYRTGTNKSLADKTMLRALTKACEELKIGYRTGTTVSAPGFYGPQGRFIKGFPIRNRDIIKKLCKKGFLNLEMESATMYALASCKHIPVAAICTAIGNRIRNDFLEDADILKAERKNIECVLRAFEILHKKKK